MPWVRRRYRKNKVWIELNDAGAYVLDERGFARLRYKPDDDRTYSVQPREIAEIDDTERAEKTPAASAAPAARGEGERRAGSASSAASPTVPVDDLGDAPDDPDIPALVGREIQAWTDGASSGNPGPAGAGVLLLFREHRKEASVYLGETTNNVAELTAIREALRLVRRKDLPVRVMTDSTYAIGVLSGAMRAKANRDLVDEIREELATFGDVRLVKVAAHVGIEGNERADALAREAIKTKRTQVREAKGT